MHSVYHGSMRVLPRPISKKRRGKIYTHVLVLTLSVVVALFLVQSSAVHRLLEVSRELQIVSAFLAGVFFTSVFTVIPATAALFVLGEESHALWLALIAAFGSVVGDTFILKFIENDIFSDAKLFVTSKTRATFRHILQKKLFRLPLTLLGALIIASPLPDELGIALLDIAKIKMKSFYLISFALNFLGIIAIMETGTLLSK
ncbi:MAG TPA: hypothetical protein DIU47_02555 [Candidatus Pacebacteria bacterium]|nr:hypothetical protein [Candidatus Paceibacterota bacterium]HCR92813.1 hypothetical protein [Candidatus Paceibacterota bacterium]